MITKRENKVKKLAQGKWIMIVKRMNLNLEIGNDFKIPRKQKLIHLSVKSIYSELNLSRR